ncbi:hypothetical protein [Phocaeicola coprophilus]|uniref:hypothetical protein n=1 Tax=Phocaeicola coprophilus TaxID=387090 RepID=UPI00241CF3B0|nr:hypothetical protein [Phocaeicola coprophilus]
MQKIDRTMSPQRPHDEAQSTARFSPNDRIIPALSSEGFFCFFIPSFTLFHTSQFPLKKAGDVFLKARSLFL